MLLMGFVGGVWKRKSRREVEECEVMRYGEYMKVWIIRILWIILVYRKYIFLYYSILKVVMVSGEACVAMLAREHWRRRHRPAGGGGRPAQARAVASSPCYGYCCCRLLPLLRILLLPPPPPATATVAAAYVPRLAVSGNSSVHTYESFSKGFVGASLHSPCSTLCTSVNRNWVCILFFATSHSCTTRYGITTITVFCWANIITQLSFSLGLQLFLLW